MLAAIVLLSTVRQINAGRALPVGQAVQSLHVQLPRKQTAGTLQHRSSHTALVGPAQAIVPRASPAQRPADSPMLPRASFRFQMPSQVAAPSHSVPLSASPRVVSGHQIRVHVVNTEAAQTLKADGRW